jgi:hypothetical protein
MSLSLFVAVVLLLAHVLLDHYYGYLLSDAA